MDIPNQPLSADIIDRRGGQGPTLAEKVRDLMTTIHSNWQGTLNHNQGPSYRSSIGPDPNDADALRDQVHSVLGSGDAKSLSNDAAARIRNKVSSGK